MVISSKLLNPGEKILVSTRTHVKALFGAVFAFVLLLAVGVVGQIYIDVTVIDWIIWGLVAVGMVAWVLLPVAVWLSSSYTFTDRRLITRQGIITRTGHDIPLSRISDIAYERGLIDRLLGCGTLVISDASTHGSVTVHDIPDVEQTHRIVTNRLHELHEGDPRDEGA